jgi:hypothetical protein
MGSFNGDSFFNLFITFQVLMIIFFGVFTKYSPEADTTVEMPAGAHNSISEKYPMFQDVHGEC